MEQIGRKKYGRGERHLLTLRASYHLQKWQTWYFVIRRDAQGGYIFGGQCLSIFRNKKLAPYQNVRAGAPVCESFLLAWLNYVCYQNFSSGWELWGLISLTSSFLRRASGGYQAREKMLNITSWRNANQNEQWGIPHQSVWPASKNLQIIGVPVAD